MKKNFKRVLSLILATCFIISASLCTTIFAAPSDTFATRILQYFDEETYETDTTTSLLRPAGIDSLSKGGTSATYSTTREVAAFGKEAEDASFKLYGTKTSSTVQREFKASLYSSESTYPQNIDADDIFTLYVDMAMTQTSTNCGYHGIRINSTKSASSVTQTEIFKFNTDNTIKVGKSTTPISYTLGTWRSFAIEVSVDESNTATYKAYIDGGEPKYTGTISSLLGIRDIHAGFQMNKNSTNEGTDLYLDNYALYVGEGYSEDRYKAIEDASALSVSDIIGDNTDLDNITTNLTLPEVGSDGSTITWASSNGNVISNKGVVTPSATQDTTVTLTATVTSGEASETKAYTVTVPKNELITFDDIKGKNLYEGSIVSNLVLPQKLSNETPIVWESSNTNIIAADGKVTRYNDASHSVTLTAKNSSDNSVVKAFDLYVIGDDIVNDNMQNTDNMKSFKNLSYINDAQWLVSGMQIADSTNNGDVVEAVYNAAPGTRVYTDVARYGSTRSISFWASPDGVEYTQFGSTKEIDGELIEFSQVGGWRRDLWYNTADVPDGTRYIKVYTANLTSAILRNVTFTGNCEADVTFDDIKGSNSAADKIMSSLVIPEGVTSVTSSNSEIIAADGTVNRAQKDTVVTLTMTINNDKVEATKIFTLTVLGTNEEIKSQKPWILYNDGSKLALVSNSSLAQGCTIEFDADVTYYGETAGKKAIGIVAVYKGTELIEVKTVKFDLASKSEAQRVSTVLALSKESSEYEGAKVCGFIWEDGTIRNLGEAVTYKAK